MMRRKDEYKIGKDKDKNRSKLNQMGINKLQKLAGALRETGETVVSSPLDDLCIDVWISVMISEPR